MTKRRKRRSERERGVDEAPKKRKEIWAWGKRKRAMAGNKRDEEVIMAAAGAAGMGLTGMDGVTVNC